ncbi:MAG: response regulator transcription factor, partial [Pedobacter sp.]
NCIIVDDEPLARQLVASYIEQLPSLQLIGSYSSALEAFGALHGQRVDLIFLDIEMPGITGMDFAKSLQLKPKVIFISAHSVFAVDAFEIQASDYLVKPVTFERFVKAVHKITTPSGQGQLAQAFKETDSIFLKVDRRLVKMEFAQMVYIEAMGDYLKVHTTQQTYLTYMTMVKIETMLPLEGFARIHRSTIVNTRFIQYIEGNFVMLNGITLSIGPNYREEFLKRIS